MYNVAEIFSKVTKRSQDRAGYQINCRLGLWGVYALTKEQAEREAWHYFIQYFVDGEYDSFYTLEEHAEKCLECGAKLMLGQDFLTRGCSACGYWSA